MMLPNGRWQPHSTPTVPSFTPSTHSTAANNAKKQPPKKKPESEAVALSDDEIRRRILANASVLFPSSHQYSTSDAYEIVYGTRPRNQTEKQLTGEENPWQYALLVRRNPSGDFTPLIRGQAWSTGAPWSMALQGLLDVTAAAIHKKLGSVAVPRLGVREELPRYEAASDLSRTATQ